jgi:hypothetical protein
MPLPCRRLKGIAASRTSQRAVSATSFRLEGEEGVPGAFLQGVAAGDCPPPMDPVSECTVVNSWASSAGVIGKRRRSGGRGL